MEQKGELECAPANGVKPAVVAVLVLVVLVVTIGTMYFMFVKPLKKKVDDLTGALDSATNPDLNTTQTATPKGVLANANLEETGRDRVIKMVNENNTPKGLITPGANEMYNTQLLKP